MMLRNFICLAIILIFTREAYSQTRDIKPVLTNSSVVKDSTGYIYPVDIWRKLLLTGFYLLKPENPGKANTSFILVRLSEEERERRMSNTSMPKESNSFTTGKVVKNFSTTDINGNQYELKDLMGKIVVINFWFIKCRPCVLEISELNNIVQEYKDTSNIVFLAIALDDKSDLKDFFKSTPFNYTIIDSGRDIAAQYNITSYPTHVVIDQEGKAYFHTAGAGISTIYWLKKSIEKLAEIKK